ncbi:MAG: hypothetical protein ACK47N_00575 [Microcystis sp.]|uniref:hypothetical protein n=1 Tax=Microcystis sp. TaxID=1127 RepID=UPI00391CB026
MGSQESGDRSQESGVRSQESGVRNQETGDYFYLFFPHPTPYTPHPPCPPDVGGVWGGHTPHPTPHTPHPTPHTPTPDKDDFSIRKYP